MWADFIGNPQAVAQLRRLAAAGTLGAQRTLVLAGPEGVGKTTLAVLFGLTLNCQSPPHPGEACGVCSSCRQAAPLDSVPELIAAALAHRSAEVRGNARADAPLRVQLHPALHLFPPDGDFLTMAQARALIHQSQLQPDRGHVWTLIVPNFDRARWTTQAALLKTLEEPPPGVVLILLAQNQAALLPTVRSRALDLPLAPVPTEELAAALVRRGSEPGAAQLLARLAHGAPGRALRFDLPAYQQLRREALQLLAAGLGPGALLPVFRLSESTRSSKEKFESLLEILYSVLQDIVYLQSDFAAGVGNCDCLPELRQLAKRFEANALYEAIEALDRAAASAQRNAFRPLALASWALGLHQVAG